MKTKQLIPDGVLIDEEDRAMLETYGQWNVDQTGYCRKTIRIPGTKKFRTILMHRVLMNPPDGMQIDHINGLRHDCRKCNLRIVTKQQNDWNRSKVKGYYWNKDAQKFQACIALSGKQFHLGLFNTEDEAHQAYLDAKKIYHVIPEYKPAVS